MINVNNNQLTQSGESNIRQGTSDNGFEGPCKIIDCSILSSTYQRFKNTMNGMTYQFFCQAKKSTPELKALPPKNEGATQVRPVQQTPSGDRTAQLEQNMKYIQEEHQATLIALHREVEVLRQKNRGKKIHQRNLQFTVLLYLIVFLFFYRTSISTCLYEESKLRTELAFLSGGKFKRICESEGNLYVLVKCTILM